MYHVMKEVIDMVGKEVNHVGYITLSKELMREILPHSRRASFEGLAEEIASKHDIYYDIDEDLDLFHFSKDPFQRNRAKEISKESELAI